VGLINSQWPDVVLCERDAGGTDALYTGSGFPDENDEYHYNGIITNGIRFASNGDYITGDYSTGNCSDTELDNIQELIDAGSSRVMTGNNPSLVLSTDPLMVALFTAFLLIYTANYVRRLFYS